MTAGASLEPDGPALVRRRSRGSTPAAELVAFAAAFGLVLVYALQGGAYDLVTFEGYGLVIWWALAVAIAVGVLPRRRPAPSLLILCGALLAYTAWTALSLTWSQSSELTTVEIARSLDYLGLLLLLGTVLGRDNWRAAAAGLAFGALAVCLLADLSRVVPGAFPANVVGIVFRTTRLSYPFGYWNAVAAWGAMSTTIGLAWSAHDTVRWRRSIALALVPAAVVMTYLSYSRAGVIGTVVGVAFTLAVARHRLTMLAHAAAAAVGSAAVILAIRSAPQIARGTGSHGAATVALLLLCAMTLGFAAAWISDSAGLDRRRAPRGFARGALAGCAVALALGAAIFGPHLARRAWHSFTRPVASAGLVGDPAARLSSLGGTRYILWKSAVKDFRAHPLDGTGAGTFEFWWNTHSNGSTLLFRNAHNIWLDNLADLGMPGLLLMLAVAVGAVMVAVAGRHRVQRSTSVGVATAFVGALVVFLFSASVDWMWQSTAVAVLALAGVAVVGARLGERAPPLGVPVRVALVALAAGAGLVQLPGIVSTTEIRSSQAAERAGNGTEALALANNAVSAEPWSASAYEQKGLVLEAAGRYSDAALALDQAVAEEPANYVHWLALARVETELGHVGHALRDYARAHQLRPGSVAFAPVAPRSG